MPRYLVLANQTAASPELTDVIREIIAKDADTEFVLLVPGTPVEDLLDWQDGDSETIARRTAQAAKDHLESVGAKVARTEVGDASPVKAIENELERHQEKIRRHRHLHSTAAKVPLGSPGPAASHRASFQSARQTRGGSFCYHDPGVFHKRPQ